MCTLVVATRLVPGFPLVVAANRDERLSRAASPPAFDGRGFIAPRDEVAGGTWLGLNRHGVFVGVTNRFGVAKDDARESRGELVIEGLAAETAAQLHEKLAAL